MTPPPTCTGPSLFGRCTGPSWSRRRHWSPTRTNRRFRGRTRRPSRALGAADSTVDGGIDIVGPRIAALSRYSGVPLIPWHESLAEELGFVVIGPVLAGAALAGAAQP